MAAKRSSAIYLLGGLGWSLTLPVLFAQKPGTVDGTIVNAVTNAPVKKASVALRNERKNYSYVAAADVAGHFEFPDVEPGTYRLAPAAQGYRYQPPSRYSFAPADEITVGEDQHLSGVKVSLVPLGVLAGKVTDEDGEPLVAATVQALRYDYTTGSKRLMAIGSTATDDRGEYRLYDLPPDRYFVRASKRAEQVGRAPNMHRLTAELGYATAFYPGGSDVSQATKSQVASGSETLGINFGLSRVPVYHIRGQVSSGPGQLSAVSCGSTPDPTNRFGAQMQPDGRFDVGGLLPGAYCLTLQGNDVFAPATVTITDQSVEGVTLSASTVNDVPGVVRVEGQPPDNLEQLSINLQPVGSIGRFLNGRVSKDGTFRLARIIPETYHISVGGLGQGVYIKSLQYGDQDVSEGIVNLRGDATVLTLRLASDSGQMSGAVQGGNGDPAANVVVTLFPSGKLAQRGDLRKTALTDQTGQFQINAAAPGDYKVFAWENYDPSFMGSDEFLAEFASRAESVTIHSSGSEKVQLKVISSDEIEQAKSRL